MLEFHFKYTKINNLFYPFIPIRFKSGSKETPVFDGIVDTGADFILINSGIAEYLNLKIRNWRSSRSAMGEFKTGETNLDLIIGRGGREQKLENIKIYVSENREFPVLPLIGRNPLFEYYTLIFDNEENKIRLIPTKK